MGTENNGYLDNDQTIVSFGVREQRMSFQELLDEDPSLMLYKWRKLRRSAKNTSVGCAIAGAGGAVLGVWTGAIPLLIAGMGVAALSGWMTKHHSEGILAIENESGILDRCRPVLGLLSQLEERGANRSDLVSLYERIVRGAIANRLDAGDPQQLKEFFQREIEQSNVAAGLLGKEQGLGIASTQLPAPQLVSTPELQAIAATAVEVDDLEIDDWATPLVGSDRPQSTEPEDDEYAWAKDLIHFPAVLVYGQQGSGKTSFTTWLLRERIKAGHEAEVWDVHRAYGQWKGLPCHGDGMDYEAVDARMGTFTRLVKERYRKISTVEGYKPSWKTAICEEFTNFDGQCQNSPSFFKQSLSDFRKVKLCVVYCGHGRTLSTLGGAKGVADMRDGGLIELELEAKIDPVTRELVSAQKGRLKLPNQAPITVKIADWMRGASDFSDIVQAPIAPEPVAIASVSDEEEAPHKGTVEKRNQGNEAILKVRAKVAKKFKALEGEWAPIGTVSTALFNNKEDRELAKRLIEVWINNGTLNSEDRAMPNGATVLFVRVNPERLTNKK